MGDKLVNSFFILSVRFPMPYWSYNSSHITTDYKRQGYLGFSGHNSLEVAPCASLLPSQPTYRRGGGKGSFFLLPNPVFFFFFSICG